MRQKPQSSDGGHDEDDNWEFEDTEENVQPATTSANVRTLYIQRLLFLLMQIVQQPD